LDTVIKISEQASEKPKTRFVTKISEEASENPKTRFLIPEELKTLS
jgi:hypothetical protein